MSYLKLIDPTRVILSFFFAHWFSSSLYPSQNLQDTDSSDYFLEQSITEVRQGQYNKAIQTVSKAKRIASKFDNQQNIANSLNNLGLIEYYRGNFRFSADFYRQALKLNKNINSDKTAESYENVSIALSRNGQNVLALAYADSSLALYTEQGKPEKIASISNRLGNIHNNLGQYEKSINQFERAIKYWSQLGDSLRSSYAYSNISVSYLSLNNLEKSEDYALQGLALKERYGSNSSVAITIRNLGVIYTKMGNLDKANLYFERSESLSNRLRFADRDANVLLQKADSFRLDKNYDSAIYTYEQIVPLLKKMNPLKVLSLYSKLAETYKLKGETPPTSLIEGEKNLEDSLNGLIMLGLEPLELSAEPVQTIIPDRTSKSEFILIVISGVILVVFVYRITTKRKHLPTKKNTTMSDKNYEYQIGLSYSRRNSNYVKRVAKFLKKKGVTYFFDTDEKANLWGKNLYPYLSEIYSEKCYYCVVFLSEHYAKSRWTKLELESAQERAFAENREYILPVRFDETVIPGLKSTVAYMDGNAISPETLGRLLIEKLSSHEESGS